MMMKPQARNPKTNIPAPNTDLHPTLARCIDMPVRVIASRAKPTMMPAAIWNGNMGPIIRKPYTAKEVA